MGKLKYLKQISIFKSIYVCFKLFPFRVALKLPLIIGRHTYVRIPKGSVELDCPASFGLISFGIGGSADLAIFESKKNYLAITRNGKLIIKGKTHFAGHNSMMISGGKITIGAGFSSNIGCRLSCVEEIEFGEKCLLGGNVVVRDSDGHKVMDSGKLKPIKKKVQVGNHVWLTNNVSVLKGSLIEDGIVVGYGSIVTGKLSEQNAIYAGHPAKLIKGNISWER